MIARLLIVGAGGHGRAVAEAALVGGQHELVGFLDDSTPNHARIFDREVLGPVTSLNGLYSRVDLVVVAIGDNRVREALHARVRNAGFNLTTVVHPRAIVSPTAIIGCGSTIMAGAIVSTEAKLGEGVIVNVGAAVDHHCNVGDFAHLGVGASMAGGSALGRCAWMQAGSALGYRVQIPDGGVLEPGQGKASD